MQTRKRVKVRKRREVEVKRRGRGEKRTLKDVAIDKKISFEDLSCSEEAGGASPVYTVRYEKRYIIKMMGKGSGLSCD